jgi:serine/threonine-protein kinase
MRQISKRVRRNRRIAFGIFFALLVSGWYLFAGPGSKVIVPSLAGFTVKDARGELKDLGLEVQIGEEEFSEDVAEGRIIKSDPAGGGRIEPNGVVTVTISKGKERFLVPNLIGLKPEVAQEQIDENKLVIGEVIEEFSDDYPKGLIIRTSPSAGERVKRDSVISLFISKGIEQIAIADYKGKSGEQALTELTEAGFNVESKYVFSEDLPPGAVISQTPGATEIDKGSKVTLFVSKGSEFVYIPKVVSLPRDKAIAILEDLELKVVVKRAGGNKSVIRISPSAGSKVKRGSSVTITVG